MMKKSQAPEEMQNYHLQYNRCNGDLGLTPALCERRIKIKLTQTLQALRNCGRQVALRPQLHTAWARALLPPS